MPDKKVMYVEEVDEETGVPIQDSAIFAESISSRPSPEPSLPPTPRKEKPNTGKARRDRTKSTPSSTSPMPDEPASPMSTRKDREARLRMREKERERERALERALEREKEREKEREMQEIDKDREVRKQRDREDRERERERDRRMRERETQRPREREREREDRDTEREPSRPARKPLRVRPPLERLPHAKTEPVIHRASQMREQQQQQQQQQQQEEDPEFFGVTAPRARSRPPSFYGKAGPPPSAGAGWWPVNQAPPPPPQSQPPHGYPAPPPPPPPPQLSASPAQYTPNSYPVHGHVHGHVSSPWGGAPVGFPMTAPPGSATEYFPLAPPVPIQNNLAHRFQSRQQEPIGRPVSVQGFRPSAAPPSAASAYNNIDVDQLTEGLGRRLSISSKRQDELDKLLMPPPPSRPQTTRPQVVTARPPPPHPAPPPSHRRSLGFDEDVAFEADDFNLYDDASPPFGQAYDAYSGSGHASQGSHNHNPHPAQAPPPSHPYPHARPHGHAHHSPPQPPPISTTTLSRRRRGSVAYPVAGAGDQQQYQQQQSHQQQQAHQQSNYIIETASKQNRRHTLYGAPQYPSPSEIEEKLRHASAYQEGVSGTTKVPLTAANVRRAGKRSSGNSSRSTRSSTSFEDSDFFRQSHTTKTSSADEDVTIRVTGRAVLKFQGAEIECENGGEFNIRQGGGGGGGVSLGHYDGVDEADGGIVYVDDNRSRRERSYSRPRLGPGPPPRGLPAPSTYDMRIDY